VFVRPSVVRMATSIRAANDRMAVRRTKFGRKCLCPSRRYCAHSSLFIGDRLELMTRAGASPLRAGNARWPPRANETSLGWIRTAEIDHKRNVHKKAQSLPYKTKSASNRSRVYIICEHQPSTVGRRSGYMKIASNRRSP